MQVFNKIKVYFALKDDSFPSVSSSYYSFTIDVGANTNPGTKAAVVMASINSNVPVIAGKQLSCAADSTTT